MPRRHTVPATTASTVDAPLTMGSVVIIDATPTAISGNGSGSDPIELSVDVTVLGEQLAPRRTRARLVVDRTWSLRFHPGAELAADLDVDGVLVAVHIPTTAIRTISTTQAGNDPAGVPTREDTGASTPVSFSRIPAFETTTQPAGRQS